jgi:Lamin Tail Domain
VNVDDTAVGATPDASAAFTVNVTFVGGGAGFLRVTEVAPWSSGNSPVGADWFELSNTGTSAVTITGWKMYDSGIGGFGSAGLLNGITTIAAGESVIFVDGSAKVALFKSNWFGANPPAGLQVGYYTGPGLSTGGDAVKIYDSVGSVLASVTFGASTPVPGPYLTFDNAAGLNNATISQLSALSINGAFTAVNSPNEVGSPGTATVFSTPIVSITATDANAAETGSNTGTFRISRTGSTTLAMDVIFSIATGAGQATSADYTPTVTSPVTIPAGQSFVDITISPVDDGLEEGAETITLTLGDTGSYDVGSPASATITIAASFTPVQNWRQTFFNTTATTGLFADTADFDGDGVANFLEYALGGDPTVGTTAEGTGLLPVGTVADASDALLSDRFSLAFVLDNPNPADLTYTIEATSDLVTWAPVASKTGADAWTWVGGGTSRIVTSGTTAVIVKVGDLVPTAGNPRRMMRLKVTAP